MIKIYLLNTDELKNIKYSKQLLSDGRREKIRKLKMQDDKDRSECAELALIYALKQLDPQVKLPLEFAENEHKKPLLKTAVAGYENLYFNISHSGKYAVCAVSDREIGVDIEYVRTKDVPNIEKILHEEEVKTMAFITNPEEKRRYFYECWVSKESYLKNLGTGISVRTTEFLVEEDSLITTNKELRPRYVHVIKSHEIKNADWKFASGYQLAICMMKKEAFEAEIVRGFEVSAVLQA